MTRTNIVVSIQWFLAGALLIGALVIWLPPSKGTPPNAAFVELPASLRGPRGILIHGGPDTVFLFSDVDCIHCRRLVQLMRDGQPLTHTVAVRFLPGGGQRGVNAAIISYCGDQQGFFRETHDALFLAEEFPTTEDLRFMIEGLDSEEMQACISAGSTRRSLQADVDSAAVAGIPGTPSAVVGDSLILGVGAILRAIRSPTTAP